MLRVYAAPGLPGSATPRRPASEPGGFSRRISKRDRGPSYAGYLSFHQLTLVTLLCCGVMAGLTWRLWEQARYLGTVGLLVDVLLVRVSLFVYYMAAMAALSTGVLAALALCRLRSGPPASGSC